MLQTKQQPKLRSSDYSTLGLVASAECLKRQKLMENHENFTSNVKKRAIEKSKSIESKNKIILGKGKRGVHEENNINRKCIDSHASNKSGPKNRVNLNSTESVFNNQDKITATVNLGCDTRINYEEVSSQMISNYTENCSKVSMLQKDLMHHNSQQTVLDKSQMSPSNKNITLDRPAPKYKKMLLERFEFEMDIDKTSDKPTETYKTPNALSHAELCLLSNKIELGSIEVVNETSKIEVVLRPREKKEKIISSPAPKHNNQHQESYTVYNTGISQTGYRLPIDQQSVKDRLCFVDNLSYERYKRPPIPQCYSGLRHIYNNHMNYSFISSVTFDKPPLSHYPHPIQPANCFSIKNTNTTDNMNDFINQDTWNTPEIKSVKETKTTRTLGFTEGIMNETKNDIKVLTEAETKKTVYNIQCNSLKRSYVSDENINKKTNEKEEPLTKRNKLGESPKLQSQDVTKKVQCTNTGYSPPILPIPSYDTIFSLLRLKDVIYLKTRYWRMSDEVADSPEYAETGNSLSECEKETEENVTENKEKKVKKISLEEYKRRKSKDISLQYGKNGQE